MIFRLVLKAGQLVTEPLLLWGLYVFPRLDKPLLHLALVEFLGFQYSNLGSLI